MQFNKTALGLTAGILWGACVLLLTFWVMWRQGGEHLILLNKFYLGYEISLKGAVIGLLWGFVDGFICGWIFAWLYNLLSKPKTAA